jgi:hypothetical protein
LKKNADFVFFFEKNQQEMTDLPYIPAVLIPGPFKKRKALDDAESEVVSGEDTSAAFSGYASLHGIDFDQILH